MGGAIPHCDAFRTRKALMAAFTLKEMDTEIPAGKAKTREHAMAGLDIAEYF